MQPPDKPSRELQEAAEAALAWVQARGQQATEAEVAALYERWVQLMRAAVARAQSALE